IELAKMSEKDRAKPAENLEKIIGGKMAKIVNEVTLYGQPYVPDTDKNVEQVLKAAGAEVVRFPRLAVGAGIANAVEDYAADVMKQPGLARGTASIAWLHGKVAARRDFSFSGHTRPDPTRPVPMNPDLEASL